MEATLLSFIILLAKQLNMSHYRQKLIFQGGKAKQNMKTLMKEELKNGRIGVSAALYNFSILKKNTIKSMIYKKISLTHYPLTSLMIMGMR